PAEMDRTIEKIGLQFGLASRLTSWIAVSEEPTVDPRQPHRTETMPQELPYGLSAEGLGLRQVPASARLAQSAVLFDAAPTFRGPMRAKARASLVGMMAIKAIKDALMKGDRTAASYSGDEAADFGRSDEAASKEIRLSGRWLAGPSDGAQILEVEVKDRAIDWQPVVRVRLTLRSGRRKNGLVDPRHTTGAARLEPGMSFRIALQLTAEVRETVTEIVIVLGKEILILHIVP